MNRYKYPRTFHIPQSPGCTSDDKVLLSLDHFKGYEIVITEKMDGENTSIYSDGYLHARSIDGRHHESRNWVKNSIAYKLLAEDKDLRICGENVFAEHSIAYDNLETYFYGFSAWNKELCLSWNDTIELFNRLDITSVPILYHGIFDEKIIDNLISTLDLTKHEGFVIRKTNSFQMLEFSSNLAKYVRKNHVQTDEHWMNCTMKQNKLKGL